MAYRQHQARLEIDIFQVILRIQILKQSFAFLFFSFKMKNATPNLRSEVRERRW
jgi:hypothetical protein